MSISMIAHEAPRSSFHLESIDKLPPYYDVPNKCDPSWFQKGDLATQIQVAANLSSGNQLGTFDLHNQGFYFRALKNYLEQNVLDSPYSAPTLEPARMQRAQTILDNPTSTAQQKASATARLTEGRFFGGGIAPPESRSIEVYKIRVINNPQLRANYLRKKEQIIAEVAELTKIGKPALKGITWSSKLGNLPVIDPSAGEAFLIHGTSKQAMRTIALNGFDPTRNQGYPRHGKTSFGMLGRGCYFSDSLSKSMTYNICETCAAYQCSCPSSKGAHEIKARRIMLCRVLLGTPKNRGVLFSTKRDDIHDADSDYLESIGRHSVYSSKASLTNPFSLIRGGGANEFCVQNAAQIYPEFIIYYRLR